MKKRKAVIIFVKYPEKGKVKTRLASTTSDNFATGIYKLLAGHVFRQVEELNKEIDVFVYYAPHNSGAKIKEWIRQDFFYCTQRGNNLGQKIANAFEETFANGYSNVLIIGSDVPEINSKIISKAFSFLNSNDIVIAPSDDGGYSLLGMNKLRKALFQNIKWSTNAVFDQTKEIINENDLNLKLMAPLNDIDTIEDLGKWIGISENKELVKEVRIISERENIII